MNELTSLYESFDLAAIRQSIAEQRVEDLHLDFKTLNTDPFDGRDDRRSLARCISGFANSDGGIVVWGVVARRNADGVDCAQDEQLIPDVDLACSRLQSLTGQAASPVPDGIVHRAVPAQGREGFLVTLIPLSDAGPHMAKLGENRYYKRSGDSFYPMEHFDLEDMFGRRKRPVLELVHRIERHGTAGGPQGTVHHLGVVIGIGNRGRGIARFPALELDVEPPHGISRYGLDGNGRTGLPRLVRPGTHGLCPIFAGGADDVIHAGSVREVTTLGGVDVRDASTTTQDVTVRYIIYAEGVRPVEGTHVIPASELLAAVDS